METPGLTLALLALRGTLVLAGALLAGRLLRRAPARTRHGLWTQALVALAVLPALTLALPTLPVPVEGLLPAALSTLADPVSPVSGSVFEADPGAVSGARGPDSGVAHPPVALPADGAGDGASAAESLIGSAEAGQAGAAGLPALLAILPGAAFALWGVGTILVFVALALSLLRSVALARSSAPADGPIADLADGLQRYLGLRRPARILLSERIDTPMAGGVLRPTVFLPAAARHWPDDRLRVVLLHELVHVRRHDPHRNLLARIALAPYWFHPLAWIAARRVVIERERACDEAVVDLGTRPSIYARHLLELADTLPRRTPAPMAALPMIQRSLLERRVMSILDPTPRRAGRRVGLATCLTLILGTGLVAAAGPAPAAPQAVRASGVGQSSAGMQGRSDLPPDSACWWSLEDDSRFSGSMSFSDEDGIRYQIGTRDGDRVIQVTENGRRLCLRAEGDVTIDDAGMVTVRGDGRVLLETRTAEDVQVMEITGAGAAWSVNGEQRPVDAAAERWRDALLRVVNDHWSIQQIRGEVSSLRGQISSLRGRQSSMNGEISSLRGQVSSMRGEISSLRGEASSLRGQISSIQGHVSSLRGRISSEQGAISSLQGRRWNADAGERQRIDERIEEHRAEIARIEQQIREYDASARIADVEGELAARDVEGRIAEVEARIGDFDLEGKVAAVQERIEDLRLEERTADIERQIEAVDADRRVDALRARLVSHLTELEEAIRTLR